MPIEFIDVVDTAVKIGLGGVITGVVTYLVTTKNHNHEIHKFLLGHEIQKIELCADKIDEYFDAWLGLLTIVAGIAKNPKNQGKALNEISEYDRKRIYEREEILLRSQKSRSYAVSRLLMLNANVVVTSIKKSFIAQKKIREEVIFYEKIPTYQESMEMMEECTDIREEVREAITNFYCEFKAKE